MSHETITVHAPVILAFTGRIGAGKTTAADYMVTKHGYERFSFARALKQSFAALFDITIEEIEAWKNDPNCTVVLTDPRGIKHTLTLRAALQRYGTESHRDVFGQDFWVDFAMRNLPAKAVCDDCRFPNEAAAIRCWGGKVIEIRRSQSLTGHVSTHQSEDGIGEPDGVIFNNGLVEDMYDFLDALAAFPRLTDSAAPSAEFVQEQCDA